MNVSSFPLIQNLVRLKSLINVTFLKIFSILNSSEHVKKSRSGQVCTL